MLLGLNLSAQYANRIESKQFTATHKVIENDTIAGEYVIVISEEWGGANHRMVYNGEFLYRKDGAYHSDNTTITIDAVNQRFEVRTKDETYYLIRKEDDNEQGY